MGRHGELDLAIAVAREAGDLLREDFHRPGGPRGGGDKAEADHEAEELIRRRLLDAYPDFGYRGEETGRREGRPGAPVWLVDPNDGTRDYLVGRRGSAVSIGLVAGGRPVLGVVHSFAYPDDGGDLFAWAEGAGPVRRNSVAVPAILPTALGPEETVLVSSKGDRDPVGNLRNVEPARYRSLPSIAHRLALVAAGEAAAATALFSPRDWDYGGGHALLIAVGGTLLDEEGRPVAYTEDGGSTTERALGGAAQVASALAARPWDVETGRWGPQRPVALRRGEAERDPGRLSRAHGCLLGQIAGDSLGALVEFATAANVARLHPDGPRRLEDGGVWDLLAGQPTDDSEMALGLARALVERGAFDAEAVRASYQAWYTSGPFDIGLTIRGALTGHPNAASQSNGSVMRASPLGILAHALTPSAAAALARSDSALTHPHPVCGDAAAAFVVAVAHAIAHGDGARSAFRAAHDWARHEAHPDVLAALDRAQEGPPICDEWSSGWALVALQNAFYETLHAASVEEGVVRTVRRGGDTDTNAAIAGALLGAVHGREGVPAQWRAMVLSCHPVGPSSRRPRPMGYWPIDVYEIAERLLLAGASLR